MLGTAFGQFIPQPMGYNPDVDGDEFIGINDIMGVLPLYNSAFDNGDSTVSVFETVTTPNDTIYVDENTDFLYITTLLDDNGYVHVQLPQGNDFSSLVILANQPNPSNSGSNFLQVWQGDAGCGADVCGLGFYVITANTPKGMMFLRGEDGLWYSLTKGD